MGGQYCIVLYCIVLKGWSLLPNALRTFRILCLGFLRPEKMNRPQAGLNPRTLDLEASTLPRDHGGRHPGRKSAPLKVGP